MSRRNTCSAYPALHFFPSFFFLASHPLAVVPCRRHHEGASVQVTPYPLQLTRGAQDRQLRPGSDNPIRRNTGGAMRLYAKGLARQSRAMNQDDPSGRKKAALKYGAADQWISAQAWKPGPGIGAMQAHGNHQRPDKADDLHQAAQEATPVTIEKAKCVSGAPSRKIATTLTKDQFASMDFHAS